MLMLHNSSTETISIKNYEIQISKSDFTHIHVYLCRVFFFLITLDIYKDYFKGCQMGCKVMQLNAIWLSMQIVIGDRVYPNSSYSL